MHEQSLVLKIEAWK